VDRSLFLSSLTVLWLGVLLQGLFAYADGWLTQSQLIRRSYGYGFTFFQQGCMWCDVFIISPLVAYLISTHHLPYVSLLSLLLLIASIIACTILLEGYRNAGIFHPEAHAHDGIIPWAGKIHAGYAIVATWILLLYLFGAPGNEVTVLELSTVIGVMFVFYPLGAWKFSSSWSYYRDFPVNQIRIMSVTTTIALLVKGYISFS
jgi:hypothetical protein